MLPDFFVVILNQLKINYKFNYTDLQTLYLKIVDDDVVILFRQHLCMHLKVNKSLKFK